MSDAHHYFMAHAVRATLKALRMPRGRIKKKQRVVAAGLSLACKGSRLRLQLPSHGRFPKSPGSRERHESFLVNFGTKKSHQYLHKRDSRPPFTNGARRG
jgi:hypothetical protein